MATNHDNKGESTEQESKVKVTDLKPATQPAKDLTEAEAEEVKGGITSTIIKKYEDGKKGIIDKIG